MAPEPPWGWRIGWPTGRLAGCLGVGAAAAGLPWWLFGEGLRLLTASAVVAAVALGLVAERLLARSPVTDGVGALAGLAVALFAHPGMALVFTALEAAGGRVPGAGFAAAQVGGITVVSLLFYGWVTLPLGALAGWVAGARVMRRQARTGAPGPRP